MDILFQISASISIISFIVTASIFIILLTYTYLENISEEIHSLLGYKRVIELARFVGKSKIGEFKMLKLLFRFVYWALKIFAYSTLITVLIPIFGYLAALIFGSSN